MRGQLGAVVRDDHQRLAPAHDDPVEFARDPLSTQRRVDHQRRAFPRAVVDHDEDAGAPSVVERVGDGVEASALLRLLRYGATLGIHQRVDLPRQAAARTTDATGSLVFLGTGRVLMHPHAGGIDHLQIAIVSL